MSTEQNQAGDEAVKPRARHLNLSTLLRDGANVAVILGVVFAVVQITMTARTERVRLAIEAASPTQSKDFLDSYSKLIEAYRADRDMVGSDSLRDDLLFVMNVYDGIAVQYLNGLLDNEIVEKRLCDGMAAIVPVLDAMKWPTANRQHFDAALKRMSTKTKSQTQKTQK
jgi:hypothetical protein